MYDQEMEKLYILCGLSSDATEKSKDEIKEALKKEAREKGYEAVCVSRYRKEGIKQYISEHEEFRILVLQEAMQTNYPYTAEELAELTDDYHLNIIVSLKKSHKADRYMKILYTGGIVNALFEEDATAQNIMKLILNPRTNREARSYYQIQSVSDAICALDIIDEERLQGYENYLTEAIDEMEMKKRYSYIVGLLKPAENLYFAKNLPEEIIKIIKKEATYQNIMAMQVKKRFNIFGKKKKEKKSRSENVPEKIKSNIYGMKANISKDSPIDDVLLEEDISDLLGFENKENEEIVEQQLKRSLEELEEKQEKNEKENTTVNRRKSWGFIPLSKVVLIVIAILLFALIILFGFFLYSEAQKKEKEVPQVYQQQSKQEISLPKRKVKETKEREKKEEVPVPNKMLNAVSESIKTPDTNPRAITPQTTEKRETQVSDTKTQSESSVMTQQQNPVSGIDDVDIQQETTSETIPETTPEDSSSSETGIFNGEILTGSEVKQVISREEKNGTRLYIQTRELGEGYFSATELKNMIDDTCSYLARGSTGETIEFIQQ